MMNQSVLDLLTEVFISDLSVIILQYGFFNGHIIHTETFPDEKDIRVCVCDDELVIYRYHEHDVIVNPNTGISRQDKPLHRRDHIHLCTGGHITHMYIPEPFSFRHAYLYSSNMYKLTNGNMVIKRSDNCVYVWDSTFKDVSSLKLRSTLFRHITTVGNSVVFAVNTRIGVWDTMSETPQYINISGITTLVAVSETMFAAGLANGNIIMGDIRTLCTTTLYGNGGDITGLVVLFDGHLISSCRRGKVCMWDWRSGGQIGCASYHTPIRSLMGLSHNRVVVTTTTQVMILR